MISKPVVKFSYILHVFPCHHLPRPTHRPVQKPHFACVHLRMSTCTLHNDSNKTGSDIDVNGKAADARLLFA